MTAVTASRTHMSCRQPVALVLMHDERGIGELADGNDPRRNVKRCTQLANYRE